MTEPKSTPRNAPADAKRRRFLAGLAVAAGSVALAPGVSLFIGAAAARGPGEPASAKTRWGMLIDVARCGEGCDACVRACREENGWQGRGRPATDPQWIRKVRVRDPKTGGSTALPVLCQHCANPPCADVCPTGATFRRADGIVLVDKHICIGCRYCILACPFGARGFVHEAVIDPKPHAPRGKGTVESCTLCVHRIDEGRVPACAEACAAEGGGAIAFGDLNDPDSPVSRALAQKLARRLRADLALDQSVLYHGL